MKKCENCGYENEDNAIKCARCNYLFIEYEKKNQTKKDKAINSNDFTNNDDFIFKENTYKDNKGYYEINLSEKNQVNEYSNNTNHQNEKTRDINNVSNWNKLNNYPPNNQENIKLNNNIKHKNPIIGLVLSFIISGLGNIYAGLYRRGIFQIILSVMLNYLTFYIYPNNMILTSINLIWAFYVMYDSYMCIVARNEGKEVPLLLGFIRFKE